MPRLNHNFLSLKPKKSASIKRWTSVDWSEMLHLTINLVLPFALVALIMAELVPIAILVVFLSKWRVFAVRFNHLPANIRANLTDFIVKLSTLSFMIASRETFVIQIMLASWYAVWLILIKPGSGIVWISVQAAIAQIIGTTAIMEFSYALHDFLVLGGIWVVVYASSYHFLSSFEEPRARLFAKLWALIGVELAWVMQHWNLKYFGMTSQFTLIELAASYVVARVYIARQEKDNRTWSNVRSLIAIAIALLVLMIMRANWSGQTG